MVRVEFMTTDPTGTGRFATPEACDDCGGYGIMDGRGGYYDAPGKGKPCSTCDGSGLVGAPMTDSPTPEERAGLRQVELKWLRGGDGGWSYQPVYRIDPDHPDRLSALLQRHDEAVALLTTMREVLEAIVAPDPLMQENPAAFGLHAARRMEAQARVGLTALDREVPDDH